MIAIPNYGLGNIGSLINSLKKIEANFSLVSNPELLSNFDKIILPGVGTFSRGIAKLEFNGWINALRKFNFAKKPILGICLGMQILFDSSEEFNDKEVKGLGFINGKVKILKGNQKYKIPHMGWNNINLINDHQIFSGISPNIDYYFVHSYACEPKNKSDILGTTEHFKKFVSVVNKDNIIAFQFHPEKSPPSGLKILKNFTEWNYKC
tara:strand:+ start:2310 stop:2933 length:624 start_codon:yes stop_codon:yes gene_type:complete